MDGGKERGEWDIGGFGVCYVEGNALVLLGDGWVGEGEEGVCGEVGEESGFEVEAVGGGYWRMLVRMKKMCGEG